MTHHRLFQVLFLILGAAATAPISVLVAEDGAGGSVVAGVATGPDVFVSDLPGAVNWGSNTVNNERVAGFSVGTTSCNNGNTNVLWIAGSDDHPVIRQNLYRLRNNRFEQIGTSWVKHGFYAVNDDMCGRDCVQEVPNNGSRLRVGCSDPYSGFLNGEREYLGPSSDVNAFTGEFPWPRTIIPTDVIGDNVGYRLQAKHVDIDPALNPGAKFFVDGHYVTHDDATAGNAENNASHRAAKILPHGVGCSLASLEFCLVIDTSQPFHEMEPAIYSWQHLDASVEITEQHVPGEGLFILGAHVDDLGDGFWRYEYALYNMNSHRSAGSFRLPIPENAIVRNIGFHDVSYGIYERWDGTDWPGVVEHVGSESSIVWATTPFSVDPEANALRWSTLYNFRFEVNAPPEESAAEVGLFRPGFPEGIAIRAVGPALSFIDCNNNGISDVCDVGCEEPGCNPNTCGQSDDCNANGVPDDPQCEADCNQNGIPDDCDVRDCLPQDLWCADCNSNTVPDGCEPDCDDDGLPDSCEPDVDCDDDGFEDCEDLCPCNTPPGGCELPEMVTCRFDNGLCIQQFSAEGCFFNGGTPMCGEPPEIRCEFGYPCPESHCKDGCVIGDWDLDGDVDFFDFRRFQGCFSGALGGPAFAEPSSECLLRFDFEEDGDVDLTDYHEFRGVLVNP